MATARRPARRSDAPAAPGDELYDCPPARFVESRQAVVRSLRADGDREGAAQVAAMRRPTASVWALNQVARHEPALIAALRTASAELHDATEHTLAGDASRLRPAQEAERAAVDDVIVAAGGHLASLDEATSGPTTQRMLDTLRATGTDEVAAARLEAGRLTEDLTWAGLGLDGFQAAATPARPARRARRDRAGADRPTADDAPSADDAAVRKRADRERARWAKLDDAATRAESESDARAAEAAEADRVASEAAATALDAHRRADQARERASRARVRADEARPG